MNLEDIKRMAHKVDETYGNAWGGGIDMTWDAIEAFAKLVAAAEREECAKACDVIAGNASERDTGTMSDGRIMQMGDHGLYGEYTGATDCAAAIRSRSKK